MSFAATKVRIENERSASYTLNVPTAEFLRPVKGYTSGPRWQAEFKLTRHTKLANTSISGASLRTSLQNKLTCCP